MGSAPCEIVIQPSSTRCSSRALPTAYSLSILLQKPLKYLMDEFTQELSFENYYLGLLSLTAGEGAGGEAFAIIVL